MHHAGLARTKKAESKGGITSIILKSLLAGAAVAAGVVAFLVQRGMLELPWQAAEPSTARGQNGDARKKGAGAASGRSPASTSVQDEEGGSRDARAVAEEDEEEDFYNEDEDNEEDDEDDEEDEDDY